MKKEMRYLVPEDYMADPAVHVMEQRNCHRQTCVHNTVTLNNKNLDQTESCLLYTS